MNKLAVDSKYKKSDSMIVVILTHGQRGSLYGTDGNAIEIEKLLSIMNAEYCKNFRGKPKLFFIQACRGGTV